MSHREQYGNGNVKDLAGMGDCQPTAAVLSVSLVQSAGTLYQTI